MDLGPNLESSVDLGPSQTLDPSLDSRISPVINYIVNIGGGGARTSSPNTYGLTFQGSVKTLAVCGR